MRSEIETNEAIKNYANLIRRICLYHLKSNNDVEDIFQNIFLKYVMGNEVFENKEHEKAWFIRVTINECKDYLRFLNRHQTLPLEALAEFEDKLEPQHQEVLEAVLSLPSKYKDVIYLYYYEGYSALEIATMLHKKENTVYSLLSRGRTMLKEKLGDDEFE